MIYNIKFVSEVCPFFYREMAKVDSDIINECIYIYIYTVYIYIYIYIYFNITLHLHLVQSDLHMRTIEAMKTNKRAVIFKFYDKYIWKNRKRIEN